MKSIEISGGTGRSNILIGEPIDNLHKYIPADNTIIVTDENVSRLYRDRFPTHDVIIIGTGEKAKTLDTAGSIYQQLIDREAQRSTFIVGIGGGIVCDITGFVASTYLRGVRFGFVSTTLLAQVDASVGGKNGVNFKGYKNMVGVFNQPEFVICDIDLLKTLTEEDLLNGFGEIVKHGAIADKAHFEYLEQNWRKAMALDRGVIEQLVYDSIVIKSAVVNRDEKESGERRKLNFGHTFGHAIEKTTGIAHGKAVSLGMVIAACLSVQRGMISGEAAQRLENLLVKLNLPVKMAVDKKKALDALKKDKKRKGDEILFVLLEGLGNAVIENISVEELSRVVNEW